MQTAQTLGYPTYIQEALAGCHGAHHLLITGLSRKMQHTLLYQGREHRACTPALMR